MRRDKLPAAISFDVSVRVALTHLRYRGAVALIFGHDHTNQNYDLAIGARLHINRVKLLGRAPW